MTTRDMDQGKPSRDKEDIVDSPKCDKCKAAEATVWFASVSGKGRATKHRYCRNCATEERVRLLPAVAAEAQRQNPQSVLGMVKQEIGKAVAGEKRAAETPDQAVKRLNKAMQAAIAKEDYEAAARIRDEIAAIRKPEGKDEAK